MMVVLFLFHMIIFPNKEVGRWSVIQLVCVDTDMSSKDMDLWEETLG